MTQACTKCKTEKPFTKDFFHSEVRGAFGLRRDCRACRNAYRANRRLINLAAGKVYPPKPKYPYDRVKAKAAKLRDKYGMTVERYNEKLAEQDGLCGICKLKVDKPLCVDHEHSTLVIRGLLCHACNFILGNAHENVENLHEASRYLTSHNMVGQAGLWQAGVI